MKYKVGDKVVFNKGDTDTGVYSVVEIDEKDKKFPYGLGNYKGKPMGWYAEEDLFPAGNLIDPEEAKEQVKKDLESGYFDEDFPLSGKEIDDVLKAVNTVQKHQSEINPDDVCCKAGYEQGYQEAKTEFYENRYQEGLQDAWELIGKIINMSLSRRKEILGDYTYYDIIQKNTASESLEKIKAYEQEQSKIEVGDEVYSDAFETKGVITHITPDGDTVAIMNDGYTMIRQGTCGLRKTGKHYDIQSILDGLRED